MVMLHQVLDDGVVAGRSDESHIRCGYTFGEGVGRCGGQNVFEVLYKPGGDGNRPQVVVKRGISRTYVFNDKGPEVAFWLGLYLHRQMTGRALAGGLLLGLTA